MDFKINLEDVLSPNANWYLEFCSSRFTFSIRKEKIFKALKETMERVENSEIHEYSLKMLFKRAMLNTVKDCSDDPEFTPYASLILKTLQETNNSLYILCYEYVLNLIKALALSHTYFGDKNLCDIIKTAAEIQLS